MMRRKIIAGNWKMNLTHSEAEQLATAIRDNTDKKIFAKTDVVLCPTYISLETVARIISGSGIGLGAQNLHYENDGAFTGEVSASILKALGCEYVILGHSERRKHFHETNSIINQKIKKALEFGLKPILCVGETFEEREDEIYEGVVEEQVTDSLEDITEEQLKNVLIAYEPVWAIGTGLNATPKQASAMHSFIRDVIGKIYGKSASDEIKILYGGSVNAKNSRDILSAGGVDGALVGGASLKADEFHEILKSAAAV